MKIIPVVVFISVIIILIFFYWEGYPEAALHRTDLPPQSFPPFTTLFVIAYGIRTFFFGG